MSPGTTGLETGNFAGNNNEIPANYLPQADGRPLGLTIVAIGGLVASVLLIGGGIWWQRRDSGLLIEN